MKTYDLPGGVEDLDQDFDVEEFRAVLYGHPKSVHFRHWKAFLDPTYDRKSGLIDAQGNKAKFVYEEKDVTAYRVCVRDARAAKRFLPQGEFETGDLAITYMPEEVTFSDHDTFIPLGKRPDMGLAPFEARSIPYNEPMIRGLRDSSPQAGLVTSSLAAVTGEGTAFLSTFRAGDVMRAAGQSLRVASVASDTALTLEAPPAPAWNGNQFVRQYDALLHAPAAHLLDVRDASRSYGVGVEVALSADGSSLQWLIAGGPSPGAGYSVQYRYLPKYKILSDTGNFRENGLPQTVTARLLQADNIKV